MRKRWKLFGMWLLLDIVLAILLFALVPIAWGIKLTAGVLYYAHAFVIGISAVLIVSSFFAFHRGSMVNLSHSVIRSADGWWHWIIFHWALGLLSVLLAGSTLLALGPLLISASLYRFVGVFIAILALFWMLHLYALAERFYLEKAHPLPALWLAWRSQLQARWRPLLLTHIFGQSSLFIVALGIETALRMILSPATYLAADGFIVPMYFTCAAGVFYITSMRNRIILFG